MSTNSDTLEKIPWADVATSGLDWIATSQQNKKNREFTTSERQAQNKFNLEQWNRANQYSSPKEQMARLKEAGLNPNLVYGSGAGQTQSANPVKASSSDGMKYEKMDTGRLPTAMLLAQVQNLIANTDQTKEETEQMRGIRLRQKEVGVSKTESDISRNEQSNAESTERINKMQEEKRNIVQLRKNMEEQNVNAHTQGQILSIQRDIANKERDNFINMDVPPNSPYWVKRFASQADQIIKSGDSLGKTIQQVMKDLENAWNNALHLGKLGFGINTLDNK